jgi:hypothetical protein
MKTLRESLAKNSSTLKEVPEPDDVFGNNSLIA